MFPLHTHCRYPFVFFSSPFAGILVPLVFSRWQLRRQNSNCFLNSCQSVLPHSIVSRFFFLWTFISVPFRMFIRIIPVSQGHRSLSFPLLVPYRVLHYIHICESVLIDQRSETERTLRRVARISPLTTHCIALHMEQISLRSGRRHFSRVAACRSH